MSELFVLRFLKDFFMAGMIYAILIGFILSIFMMCESIVVNAERRCGDA